MFSSFCCVVLRPDHYCSLQAPVTAQAERGFKVISNRSQECESYTSRRHRRGVVHAPLPHPPPAAPESRGLPQHRCQVRFGGGRLADSPSFPMDDSEPLTHCPVFTTGYNSEDSLCEPSRELEFLHPRQHGEWSVLCTLPPGFSVSSHQ